ncbi:YdcF family protein [Alterisphingorhabdus coralli]|uniref:YdcF family protein n=1 Tax=Alterisphingorhabdus coralli TaxID=3071408 RepID=A0AA97I0P4_9SPHN|nr:YdcF family protein [Parasphingorhabdus sp. SCSIO 66989]WOE75197.1 YdcF family protein [Parasphingorhabdus sp. SCSIO 66989]
MAALLLLGSSAVPGHALAEQASAEAHLAAQPLADPKLVASRVFPLAHRLASKDLAPMLADNVLLRSVLAERVRRIDHEVERCGTDTACTYRALQWTADETEEAGSVLRTALDASSALPLLAKNMRASGEFARHAALDDGALLDQAWRDLVAAQNHIIAIYGLGEEPRYPRIDAISFDPQSEDFAKLTVELLGWLRHTRGDATTLADDPGYRTALHLLHVNMRENAGYFPDLHSHHNRAAQNAVAAIDWSVFRYSAILVLGDGPDAPGQRVGSFGKIRLAHAARLYHSGLAPLLIVSGGNVHPARTPINEALEMKRVLMQRYAVPEAAIIMEPYARHTTTNFRNAARLMLRYGVPTDKLALVSTSTGHSRYAQSEEFRRRCIEELGYVPREFVERISPYDYSFRINPLSTHRDARDPLDP